MKHLKLSENKKSKLPLLAGMLLIIASLLVATKLVQKSQDTRSSAASGYCTYGSKKCFGDSLGTCKQTSVHSYWSKTPCRYGCANNKCKPNPAKPTCTWTCTAWTACDSSGIQYCNSQTKSPSNCTGGTSVTKRSCTKTTKTTKPICTSFTYGPWSTCTNGKQTRSVTSKSPSVCAGGSPKTTQSCTAGHGGGGAGF